MHDARVLSNSTLFKKGNNNQLFPKNCEREICRRMINLVISGNAAYPLLSRLMKPYPENNTTPRKQNQVNYQLTRTRRPVENTLGRWIRLLKKGRHAGFLCCYRGGGLMYILHIICQIQNIVFLPAWEMNNEAGQDPVMFCDNEIPLRDAADIRETLSHYISP